MTNWTRAVIHPLGLAGYALACVFGVIAKYGPIEKWPWLAPVAVSMAVVALIGGLLLAGRESRRKIGKAPQELQASTVTQHTEGDQSSTVANTSGDVSINYEVKPPKK